MSVKLWKEQEKVINTRLEGNKSIFLALTYLTLYLMGYKFMQFWWGEAFNASPLKPWKMKLQSHVRGQNGGFWGCPAQLDHFQVANTCISRVYTCLQCWECQNITFYIFVTQRCVRSQSRGSWGCQTQLDHCHMSTTCISHVYTCPPWYQAKW